MRLKSIITLASTLTMLSCSLAPGVSAANGNIEYMPVRPIAEVLRSCSLKPVKAGPLRVPTITWGGDEATIYDDQAGIFKQEGLNVQLFCENDFAKQVQGCLDGDTPLLRGTMGMINSAAPAFERAGTQLVVLYQLTWSTGGDCLVVRDNIKSLSDLKGKTIAVQMYGPHMDYLTTVLARVGLKPSDVHIKWMKELSIPTYDTHGKVLDPRSAFAADKSIDACFVISPDAAALTTGNGAEGSVKGSKILFSSRSASRIISDVYACRKDYFDAHPDQFQKFTHALMLGQESFDKVVATKVKPAYPELLKRSGTLLFGSAQATSDAEGMLGDCEFVKYDGNVAFFTGQNTTRNFKVLKNEIQTEFIELGIMKTNAPLTSANWDYRALAAGLTNVNMAAVPKFNEKKVAAKVSQQIATESATWEEGTLYNFEIRFAPNQTVFAADQYADAFKKALDLSQTMGGALVVIEGHNAPDLLNKAKKEGKSAAEISVIEQIAKNVSLKRAQAVRKAYLDYCKTEGLKVDESQFVAVGMGATSPKFAVPATESEWNANRRVVFRIKSVETELNQFQGGN